MINKESSYRSFIYFTIGFLLLFLSVKSVDACTSFCIISNSQIVLAKNLDWEIADGLIFTNKRGVRKTAYTNHYKKLSWISKYGSVTFNQFGKEFPLGGMNESGLVIEELNSWGETPKNDGAYKLNEFQWVQYCLDNFASIEELIASQNSLEIQPLFLNLHYLICDSNGKTAIVEFYEGKSHFYDKDDVVYPILSNNHYKNSLKNIKLFQGFGGDLLIKNDLSSNGRFVKAASLLKNINSANYFDGKEAAFNILDSVSQSDTKWSIVYDISRKEIHFKTALNKTEKIIKLKNFDFSCKTPVLILNVNRTETNNLNSNFVSFKSSYNMNLLISVYDKFKLYEMGEHPKSTFLKMANYGNSIKCDE